MALIHNWIYRTTRGRPFHFNSMRCDSNRFDTLRYVMFHFILFKAMSLFNSKSYNMWWRYVFKSNIKNNHLSSHGAPVSISHNKKTHMITIIIIAAIAMLHKYIVYPVDNCNYHVYCVYQAIMLSLPLHSELICACWIWTLWPIKFMHTSAHFNSIHLKFNILIGPFYSTLDG